jgi:hypothetical protein
MLEGSGDLSKVVADKFVEALRELEEDRNVEDLVGIHTEDCEVGNVSVPETFRGHEGLREFWTSYRSTFVEMKSEFRNIFAAEERAALEWICGIIPMKPPVDHSRALDQIATLL